MNLRFAMIVGAVALVGLACDEKKKDPAAEMAKPAELKAPEAAKPAAPAGKKVEFTAEQLYAVYKADHKAGWEKHRNDTIVVSGDVWGVSGAPPFAVGITVPNNDFGGVMARTDEAAAKAAGVDKEGAKAKFECTWAEQDVEAVDISLTDCKLVK
jgi:hypothetical protein